MYTRAALLDLHRRSHRSLEGLLAHCRNLTDEELHREMDGFGYPTVQLQLHHEISAEKYWVGVLEGRMDVDETEADYPTVDSLETYRREVLAITEGYLNRSSEAELNTSRPMMTWGNREQVLVPAHVILRTQVHLFQHQGQILAMCRLFGKPKNGLDFPLD